MLLSQKEISISTLLSKFALDANHTRQFIEQQELPYQMPELSFELKLALSSFSNTTNSLSSIKVSTILPGQVKVPVSTISSKLASCPGKQFRALSLSVATIAVVSDGLMIQFNVTQTGLKPQCMVPIEVNINRELAMQLNNQLLKETTEIVTSIVQPDELGQIAVKLKVSASDQGTVKLPLTLSALHQQRNFIFTTDI